MVAQPQGLRTVPTMTDEQTPDALDTADHVAELRRFLTAYQPSKVHENDWAHVADDAVHLVLRAGPATRLRVEKDIQLLGAVVAHLVERGRPVTLDDALSDATLLSFDSSLTASTKTRENKRGIARRLQAVHRGLPWRMHKRSPNEPIDRLVSYEQVETLHRITRIAHLHDDDPDAGAFMAAVSAARTCRKQSRQSLGLSTDAWMAARRFAKQHGWNLTLPILRNVVVHAVLASPEPIAVLIASERLTRANLDLALTGARDLPDVPDLANHNLLRGTA